MSSEIKKQTGNRIEGPEIKKSWEVEERQSYSISKKIFLSIDLQNNLCLILFSA